MDELPEIVQVYVMKLVTQQQESNVSSIKVQSEHARVKTYSARLETQL